MRTKTHTMELKECDDFISDMIQDQQHRILLATRCLYVTACVFSLSFHFGQCVPRKLCKDWLAMESQELPWCF